MTKKEFEELIDKFDQHINKTDYFFTTYHQKEALTMFADFLEEQGVLKDEPTAGSAALAYQQKMDKIKIRDLSGNLILKTV